MQQAHKYAIRSLISITIAGILITVHHVYRLGWEVLPAFSMITILPTVLLYGFRKTENKLLLGVYGLVNVLIFIAFGFFDGFLDHVFKLIGLSPITFLAGSDAEVVETVFQLWSVQAGHWFYELTGVFSSIASFIALFYTVKFIMARWNLNRAENQPLELQHR